jgi:hypothetical protein
MASDFFKKRCTHDRGTLKIGLRPLNAAAEFVEAVQRQGLKVPSVYAHQDIRQVLASRISRNQCLSVSESQAASASSHDRLSNRLQL